MNLYLSISQNTRDLQNIFIILFLIAGLFLMLNKSLFSRRFSLNITSPNIYIFEFEAQAKKLLSLYNINNFLIKLLAYVLFSLALIKLHQTTKVINFNQNLFPIFFKSFLIYIIVKFLLEELYLRGIKQSQFIDKVRLIRLTYENYVAFYLIIFSFLIFYFPYHSSIIFDIIISISAIWLILVLFNFFRNLNKHIEIKNYQIFLYLCLSEILPIITVIGWIIFQIL